MVISGFGRAARTTLLSASALAPVSMALVAPMASLVVSGTAAAQTAPQTEQQPTAVPGSRRVPEGAAQSDTVVAEEGLEGDEESEELETEKDTRNIVVTGTSLRGVAPTGTNSVNISAEDIEATGATSASQVLATIPQIGGNFFNSLPQMDTINTTAVANQAQMVNRPNLRPTPSSSLDSGNSTLILLDGNRTAGVGVNQNTASPDQVPPALLERVEVNTDGASAVYGSDAIAGVINYVTRKRFDGIQLGGNYGIADDYEQYDVTGIVGKDWGSGSAYISYTYASADKIFQRDRDYVNPINFVTGLETDLNCDVENIRTTGTPQRFYTTTETGFVATPFTIAAPLTGTPNVCRAGRDSTLASGSERHGALASFSQDFSDSLNLTVRGRYAKNEVVNQPSPSGYTATISNTVVPVPGTTPVEFTRPNPFFRPLVGTPDAAVTSYSVLGNLREVAGLDFFELIQSTEQWGGTATLTWDVSDNWQFRGVATYDESKSFFQQPSINGTALNNGFNTNASTPCSRIGTAAACFNPFNLAASDPALLAGLFTNTSLGQGADQIWDFKATIDGTLFTIGGGDIRVAVGGEYLRDHFRKGTYTGLATGADAALAAFPDVTQEVKSAFAEVNIPLVSSLNDMPGIRELRIAASGRYDSYTTFGDTFNPRLGASYKPFDWIKIRGNWNTSFRAPSTVDILGMGVSNSTISNFPANQQGGFGLLFVDPARPIPASQGGPTATQSRAIVLQGTDPNLGPQTGEGWSIGVDLTPMQGLTASVSYYNTTFEGAFGNPCLGSRCFPDYATYATLFPITQDQLTAFVAQGVGAAITTPLSDIYGLFDVRKTNVGNARISGIDYSARYTRDVGFGTVFASLSGNLQLNNESQVSDNAPWVDQIAIGASRHRASVQAGLTSGGFRGSLTLQHSEGYRLALTATNLSPRVGSYDVVNMHLNYVFPDQGLLSGTEVSLTVNNLFDQDPPVVLNGQGYANGRTIGRLIILGLQKKFDFPF